MSEPAHGSDSPDPPADPVLAAEATAVVAPSGCGLVVGERWRDLTVEAFLEDHAGGSSFLADHIGLMQKVVIRATRIPDSIEWRRQTWEQLRALPENQVLACLQAYEEGGWRYEISVAPPPTTLREWIACHRPSLGDIVSFVRQLADVLGTLHRRGVVHLNLRPETVFVDESGREPIFLLSGFSAATLFDQPELIPIEVNPFYAPPEAAGLTRHTPGPRLCAWDWWTLGRLVQEFLLGRHVLSLVLDRDVSRVTPELMARAELLLLERDPPDIRPGALDYMPTDPVAMPLLRGLLTTALEPRWGLDAVQRWLRREPVKEHYDLPRNARLWTWRGRGFTVGEAAEFFTQTENWDAGEDMLFQTDDPTTLSHFLKEVPAHRADWDRLQAVCELAESAAWQDVPVIVRRTIAAAIGWLSLCNGSGGKPVFRVRGHVADLNGLASLLNAAGAEKAPALFRALLSPAVIQCVEALDGPGARVLKTLATTIGRAVQLSLDHGWLDRDDNDEQVRMLSLAFSSGAVLRERLDLLRAGYATNTDPLLAQLMAGKSPTSTDLIVLAHVAQAPEKKGFISHERWRRQRCAAFKIEAEQIVTRLFWVQTRRLLAMSRLWGMSSTGFAAITLICMVWVGWGTRRIIPTALIPTILLLSRVWLWWRLRHLVRRFDGTAAPWKWGDGLARSSTDLKRVLFGTDETPAGLRKHLRDARHAIAEIVTDRAQRPRVTEPFWWDIWVCLGAAAAATAILIAEPLLIRRNATARLDPKANQAIVAPAVPVAPPVIRAALNGQIITDPEALLATGRYEVVNEGFGRQLRGPLEPWDRRPPQSIATAEIVAIDKAAPHQAAYAKVSGAFLLEPYGRNAVGVLLALRVPTDKGFGVVVYNARDRVLYERRVYVLRAELTDNTWYQLGRFRVLYLESRLPAGTTISLAPP